MAGRRATVFVLGLDAFNRRKLAAIPDADAIEIVGLLPNEAVEHRIDLDIDAVLAAARRQLDGHRGSIDGLINYIDFPGNSVAAILAAEYGVRGPRLDAVLACEHKYWSRRVQAEVAPDAVPPFRAVDPFDPGSVAAIDLAYPYWLKPIKGFASWLGFRIGSAADRDRAIAEIRRRIHQLGRPFDQLMDRIAPPDAIAGIGGHHCIAEALVRGRQCTVEGHVFAGEIAIHGVIDSVRARNRSSFRRYVYPSGWPDPVKRRARGIATDLVRRLGLDDCGFNIELFWDEAADRLQLLEINPRISQSHCDLFEKVDGTSSHAILVDIALGRRPRPRSGGGSHRVAGKFFIRAYGRQGRVVRVPGPADIDRLHAAFPDAELVVLAASGDALDDRPFDDSYTATLAQLYLGADSHAALRTAYRRALDLLPFAARGPQGPVPVA
jgi:hypothetical protein